MQKRSTYLRRQYNLLKTNIKKSKWMTYGILKSINTKDILYKKLVKADIHDEIRYSTLKAEFSCMVDSRFKIQ